VDVNSSLVTKTRGLSASLALGCLLVCGFACSGDDPHTRTQPILNAGQGGANAIAGTGAAANGGGVAGSGGAGSGTQGTSGAGAAGTLAMLDSGLSEPSDASADSAAMTDGGLPSNPGLIGWASVEGDGVPTTTGGLGGQTVTPTSADELQDYAERDEPLIIRIEGTFSVPRLHVSSNKTLVGIDDGATIEGGIRIRGRDLGEPVQNVIVQNLRVHAADSDVDGDGVQIYYAHHVWIDHCEIWDAPDGNLDIVHGSNWVTVSNSHFHYTSSAPAQEHRFSNLIGHTDDNADEDRGRLKVTFHHNLWGEGVRERMPRVRYGEVHVFNNHYAASSNNYAIGAGFEARLRIENNYFEAVASPHIFYDGESTAEIVAAGNVYVATSGEQQSGQGAAFVAPYPYSLDDANSVPASVTAQVGPR
jgi:pectate lyase